jgi:hypothetical protein
MSDDDVKEDFCGICAAVPLALAGLGGTAYAASGAQHRLKNTIVIVGCSIVIIVSVYFLIKYSSCSSCRV